MAPGQGSELEVRGGGWCGEGERYSFILRVMLPPTVS